MWGVSAAWLAAAAASGPRHTKLEVLSAGAAIAELDLTLDGTVTIDRAAAVRRQVELRFVDDGTLTVADAHDLLAPYGNELRPWIGYDVAGAIEWAPLGTMRIAKPRVRESRAGVDVSVRAFDRARTVQRNRWTAPYQLDDGTPVEDAIAAILTDRIAGAFPLVTSMPTTGDTVPAIVLGQEPDSDPWADCMRLAADSGYELSFDVMGAATLRADPDLSSTPALTLAGGVDARLLEITKDIDDERGYNGVIVVAEGTHLAAPLRSEVWDTDPDSATYHLGPYGQVPLFWFSPIIRTQAQADRSARTRLQRVLGVEEQVEFSALTCAALEAGDVLHIERERVAVDGDYVLERLAVPLQVTAPMSGITRSRRVLL